MDFSEPFAMLVREHEEISEAVASARGALEAAAQYPEDASLGPEALQEARALRAFMAGRLALHILKEEEVLFPAYRTLSGDARLIDELVVQHDRVRERHVLLRRALAALDHNHHEVEEQRDRLADQVAAGDTSGLTPALVEELLDTVRRLDWILQGHFGDEEDDLFTPGETLFDASALQEMARQMQDLEDTAAAAAAAAEAGEPV